MVVSPAAPKLWKRRMFSYSSESQFPPFLYLQSPIYCYFPTYLLICDMAVSVMAVSVMAACVMAFGVMAACVMCYAKDKAYSTLSIYGLSSVQHRIFIDHWITLKINTSFNYKNSSLTLKTPGVSCTVLEFRGN